MGFESSCFNDLNQAINHQHISSDHDSCQLLKMWNLLKYDHNLTFPCLIVEEGRIAGACGGQKAKHKFGGLQ